MLGALGLVCAIGSRAMLFPRENGGTRPSWKRLAAWGAALALGAAVPLVLLVLVTQVDLLFIQRYNLWNALRAEAQRPYLMWLFYGPVEFFQLLGLPLAMASAISLVLPAPQAGATDTGKPAPWYRRVNAYAALFWLVIVGLDVAGRSKAEQGRLFLFLMPLALMGVYYWASRRQPGRGFFTVLFFAQMAVCVVIGARWFV